ncbi:MAG TPA: PPOX class F420-dependent oxidoreductase [Acidimicrobiales bacterium]|nr:PPOX class F420-dependent oxidoreductase [Acidimicrobiales bacterium]
MQPVPAEYLDLLDSEVLTLATISQTGRPQLSVVWFLAEEGTVHISVNSTRQKALNLLKNPACSVLIIDPASPYRYLEIRGTATVEEDKDRSFAQKVGAKYKADLSAYDEPGATRLVITVPNERVIARDLRQPSA